MHILFTAGALRTDSFNKKHAKEALRLAIELGHTGEFVDLRDHSMPVYDGDIEAASGVPKETQALAAKIARADALVISTPEYNGGIPGVLKNVLDWLSRLKPMPLADKHLLLLAASPGAMGGLRSLWHTRVPFEAVGVHVYPTMSGLSQAGDAFDDQGKLKDEKKIKALKELLEKFTKHVGK